MNAAAGAVRSGTRVLRLDGVRVGIGDREILHGISLDLAAGESIAIVGESGSGKSTLLRAASGLLPVRSGTVLWGEDRVTGMKRREVRRRRRRVQLVHQDSTSTLDPRLSVLACVREGLELHRIGTSADRDDRARSALRSVGIGAELHGRLPRSLSGGQRQRVGIARALVLDPEVVLFDEPLSSLDVVVQQEVVRVLTETRGQGRSASVFVLHDLALVAQLASRVIVMRDGRIVEEGETHRILHSPRNAYTVELVEAARAAAWRRRPGQDTA